MTIDGIGTTVIESLDSWLEENAEMVFELLEEVEIIVPEEKTETTQSAHLADKEALLQRTWHQAPTQRPTQG